MMRVTMSGEAIERVGPVRAREPAVRPLRVGLIGMHPPRRHVVETFTSDVAAALRDIGDDVVVTALVDSVSSSSPDATYRMVQSSEQSARLVASTLSTDVDVVLIEHDFGFFGGEGSAVLQALTDALTVPYVISLHTVMEAFRPWQLAALSAPLAGAGRVFVFSEDEVGPIVAQFGGEAAKCVAIPGVRRRVGSAVYLIEEDTLARALTDNHWRHTMATRAREASSDRSRPMVGRHLHEQLTCVVDDRWAEGLRDPQRSERQLVSASRGLLGVPDLDGLIGHAPPRRLASVGAAIDLGIEVRSLHE